MADVHPVSSPQTLRRAALFPGNNTFLCGGRLMMGADPSVFLLAELMIWGPAAAFFAIVSPHQHAAVGAAVALLLAVVIYLHVRTAFTEPGIIPRSDSLQRPPTPPDATAQGVRYCDTCRIWRPPRAKHCKFCDNCVLRFDHHCPWAGNCIGERNYRFFFWFVVLTTILAFAIMVLCFWRVYDAGDGSRGFLGRFGDGIRAAPVAFTLALYGFVVGSSVFSLCSYHSSLICSNMTTNEELRGTFRREPNPFDRGWRANCQELLCAPLPPSRVGDLTQSVSITEGDFSGDLTEFMKDP